ncbi:MAG: Gfo/Idh/MocA family oxidoreductase, partial [Eubacteriales bacterium]|nr:Gfo/Idh/MocA family oxidoreductase [Eubacteriales bacterium]
FGMPTKIRAFCHIGKWHKIEVEDDVTAYMEFPSGATGVFITSTADLPGVNRLEVTFDRGRIICDGSSLELWRIPVSEREFCFTSEDAFGVVEKTHEKIETDGENPQHLGVLRAFALHILTGAPLIAEGAEGINSLMISNAMYLSSWEGKDVSLPIDEDEFLKLLDEKRAHSAIKTGKDVTYKTDHSFGGQILPEDKA